MKNIKESYYQKANDMISRLFDEAEEENTSPEATDTAAPEGEEPATDQGTEPDAASTENGQAEQVQIFFNNLNEETQKVVMDILKEKLNASPTDEVAKDKILEKLKEKPLVNLSAEEIINDLKIEI